MTGLRRRIIVTGSELLGGWSFVSVKLVAGSVSGAVLATGLGVVVPSGAAASPGLVSQAEIVKDLSGDVGTLSGLGALPSDSPAAGFEAGGGGLVGEPWPVWGLPGARGADDPGIAESELPQASTGSLRPQFTAVPGKDSYRFEVLDMAGREVLWDSGVVVSDSDDCVVSQDEVSCTLPLAKVGELRNKGTYRVRTQAGGVTRDRLFYVKVDPGVSGENGVVTLGQMYESSAGSSVQVGLGYSTADQGPTPVAGEVGERFVRDGLPPGWEWIGPVGGFVAVERTREGLPYSGFEQLLTVRLESASQTLGCVEQQGSDSLVCGALSGDVLVAGLSAVIYPDGSVVVSGPDSGQNWTFDADDRLVEVGAVGLAPTQFEYRSLSSTASAGEVLGAIVVPDLDWSWQFHYSGDQQCSEELLPAGFVAAPPGYACGWSEPDGNRSHILYTQPEGAQVPRVSRVVHAPGGCDWWQCDASQLGVFDLGWDDHNRVRFHRQDGSVEAMVLGNLEAQNPANWGEFTYDELGRLSTVRQPVAKPEDDHGDAVGPVVTSYSYELAPERFRPAVRQVVTTKQAPGAPELSTIDAVDAAGRLQFEVAEDGVVNEYVWHADNGLHYGTVFDGRTVTGREYDKHDRVVKEVSGPAVAFDLQRCAPDAADRGNESCRVLPDAPVQAVTIEETRYDEPSSVGQGLRAQWFANSRLTGHPVAAEQLQQGSGSEPGFVIDPPASVGDEWSVSMSGALVLPDKGSWNVTVEAPAGMLAQGSLFAAGKVCAVLPAGGVHATCTVESGGDDRVPVQLVLAHNPAGPATGRVVVSLQPDPFTPPTTDNDHFLALFGAVAATTMVDHDPDGRPIEAESLFDYEDPNTALATKTTLVALGQTAGPQHRVTGTEYERTAFGGNQPKSFTNESGSKSTLSYWEIDDTPRSAGVANLDQIPKALRDVPQFGRVQYTESSGGAQQWSIYDRKGVQLCEAIVQKGHDPAWSCEERDARGRLTKTTVRGQDDQAPIITDYRYLFDPEPGHSPFIIHESRQEAGKPTLSTVTREWAGGLVDQYIDAHGATTHSSYEPYGVIKETRITIDPALARPQSVHTGQTTSTTSPDGLVSVVSTMTYDQLMRPKTIGDDTGVLAQVRYFDDDPRRIMGYAYFDGELSLDISYDQYHRVTGATWKTPDTEVETSWTATASGRVLTERFDNLNQTYDYDGWGRLTQAVMHGDGAENRFMYGWDSNSQRICASHEVDDHAQGHCDQAQHATTFTYQDDRLVGSSSPTSHIPDDPFTKDGSYKQVGYQSYTYDAARQLVSAESKPPSQAAEQRASGRIEYLRDSANRILTQTTTGELTGAYTNVYSQAGTGANAIAVVTTTGEVIPTQTLPGGLTRQGDQQLTITAASGLASLTLDGQGRRGDHPIVAWGPYGEPTVATTQDPTLPTPGWHGQNTAFDASLINLGARAYRSDLAMFLRPDPVLGGSGTANEYAYVSGDPINTADLSGTFTEWKAILANVLTLGLELITMTAVYKIVQKVPLGFAGRLSGAARIGLSVAASTTTSAGLTVGFQTAIQGGYNMNHWHWLGVGLTSAVAGAAAAGFAARNFRLAQVKRKAWLTNAKPQRKFKEAVRHKQSRDPVPTSPLVTGKPSFGKAPPDVRFGGPAAEPPTTQVSTPGSPKSRAIAKQKKYSEKDVDGWNLRRRTLEFNMKAKLGWGGD